MMNVRSCGCRVDYARDAHDSSLQVQENEIPALCAGVGRLKKGQIFMRFFVPPEIIKCLSCILVVDSNTVPAAA